MLLDVNFKCPCKKKSSQEIQAGGLNWLRDVAWFQKGDLMGKKQGVAS